VTTERQTATPTGPESSVWLYADPGNSDPVYISADPTVTANSADASDGWCIRPGNALQLPTPEFYMVAASAAKF
jgi:hypothetical protein